ncbi:MAG: cell wall hydrolase [Sphingomonas sp.]|uniref:cell wall hydrolase n=1 Tax=Sphingomonas sp. TaxID=28214 RepID=UPI003F7D0D5C
MTEPTTKTPSLALRLMLGAVAILLVVLPAAIVTLMPPVRPVPKGVVIVPRRVVPRTELPPVEPVEFQSVDPNAARAFNATVPFSTLPNPAARPFVFSGSTDARLRAIDCLAAAELYEAGDDAEGERAVAQVVLNRVRHPAFPKSVCGVVFQGSDRNTGCQFTFACDGAMSRWHPSPVAWKRARDLAIAALNGSVFAKVGYATHYHTDWVVPYWSSSLDKIAAVETHLFFRWTGWWGTPAAFVKRVSGVVPNIAMLAGLSSAHTGAVDLASVAPAEIESAPTAGEAGGSPLSIDPNSFLVTLDARAGADTFPAVAMKACGARDYCKLMAWTDKKHTPASLPLGQAQIATMSFSYLRDKAHGYEKALWNCGQFKRASKGECMKLQVLGVPQPTTPLPGTRPLTPPMSTGKPGAAPSTMTFSVKPTAAAAPDGLSGVRRKAAEGTQPKPAATPVPRATASLPDRP